MEIVKGGKYYVEGSDILIHVLNVAYSGKDYIKARIRETNIRNGIFYGDKYYKLDRNKIRHWKIYDALHDNIPYRADKIKNN